MEGCLYFWCLPLHISALLFVKKDNSNVSYAAPTWVSIFIYLFIIGTTTAHVLQHVSNLRLVRNVINKHKPITGKHNSDKLVENE